MTLCRRGFIGALATVPIASILARSARGDDAVLDLTPLPAPTTIAIVEWVFAPEDGVERRAMALVPKSPTLHARLPLVVALHGWGEGVDAVTGVHGWPEAYELVAAMRRLTEPPIDANDLGGLVEPARLASINASLRRAPYVGHVVVCPFLPRTIGRELSYARYADWMARVLLPRARSELAVLDDAASTGIDGVSMGGRAALEIGAIRRDLFGVVGALQPQIDSSHEALAVADMLANDIGGRPIRITTSTDDIYRVPIATLDAALTAKKVAHDYMITIGPHDYPWNRGPGAYEMLLWNDRALRTGTK